MLSRRKGFIVSWMIILAGSFLCIAVFLSSSHDTTSDNYLPQSPQQQQQQQLQHHQHHQHHQEHDHRRLQERKTLSPGAKASVQMAHEMAVQKAKDSGRFVYENKGDPFQEMQSRAHATAQGGSSTEREEGEQQQAGKQQADQELISTAAFGQLLNSTQWKGLDPLTMPENNFDAISSLPRIPYEPQVEYLGVMVDAGRHYFPIQWWKRLIVYLHKLRYNMIHIRLTDDENFVVRLDSYPQLAYSTAGKTYTPKQLEGLVALAKSYNITMVPEINLPLRAASWAGIPGLVVGCPNFICDVAHYVPVNIHHNDFPTILHGVLEEVLSIFDRPPMLHLGGTMSVHDADGCLKEAGMIGSTLQYLDKFETILSSVLTKLAYPVKQVIRTQSIESKDEGEGGDIPRELPTLRVGGIEHYWMSLPHESTTTRKVAGGSLPESLVSTGVDFAVDRGFDAVSAFANTQQIMQLPRKPKGIVAGTFFLGTDFWLQQNVLARLISVAMGAAHGSKSSVSVTSFPVSYNATCHSILKSPSHPLCELRGRPTGTPHHYLEAQMKVSQEWRHTVCDRLAFSTNERVFQPYMPDRNYATTIGNEVFWKTFHRPPKPHHQQVLKEEFKPLRLVDEVKQRHRSVKKIGIILDLANSLASVEKVAALVHDFIAPLGLDMLQIRLVDDFAFAVRPEAAAKLAQSQWAVQLETPVPKMSEFKSLVDVAKAKWNMEVFPEVSITTDAGGWIHGGYLVHCPLRYCKEGTGISNDIRQPQFLALVYSVLRELQETFGSSSYLHLGSDERVENLKCYEEDGLKQDQDPPFGSFEAKLKKLLLMLGIKPKNVIRYDNDEQLSYKDRVGDITHYRVPIDPGSLPDIREGEPFFVTASLLEGNIYSVYKRAKEFVRLKPIGLMGEIRTLQRSAWVEQHMGLRLLAFLLGASSREGEDDERDALSHEDFVKEAIKLCIAIKFPVYVSDPKCEEAEKLLKGEKVQTSGNDDEAADEAEPIFPVGTEEFREILCQKHTRPRKTMAMKEEYLLAGE